MLNKQIVNKLINAKKELYLQNKVNERCLAELNIANRELVFQNKEKEKRAAELTFANQELEKAEHSHREYILSLKKIMYMTSHQLRQPIAHILGLSEVLDAKNYTGEELVEITGFIKQSAECLDKFTMELTAFIYELEIKAKSKKPGKIVLS